MVKEKGLSDVQRSPVRASVFLTARGAGSISVAVLFVPAPRPMSRMQLGWEEQRLLAMAACPLSAVMVPRAVSREVKLPVGKESKFSEAASSAPRARAVPRSRRNRTAEEATVRRIVWKAFIVERKEENLKMLDNEKREEWKQKWGRGVEFNKILTFFLVCFICTLNGLLLG